MAAPKENQFAIGNSGKHKIWKTTDELQGDIDAYFEWNESNPVELVHGSQIDKKTNKPLIYTTRRPLTIEGLCLRLECDRDTLLNYQKKEGYEEYFGIIKKAKLKIQQDKVERGILGTGTASVIIFDLKNNHGYRDKVEIDHESPSGSMSPRELSPAAAKAISDKKESDM